MTQRSGCRQSFCSRLINSPDEVDAMTISGSRTASNRANKARFNFSRSGALSWTNSAPARAASGSVWKVSAAQAGSAGSGDSRARLGQAAPTNSCRKVSAPGAGSLAATVSPRAKNTAVQLAPIVPVPIAAMRLILSPAMSVSSRRPAPAEPKASMSDRERRPAHQRARFGRFSTRRMLRRLVSATGRSGSLSGIAAVPPRCHGTDRIAPPA